MNVRTDECGLKRKQETITFGMKLHSALVGYSDEGMAGWLDWPKKIGIWTIFNI